MDNGRLIVGDLLFDRGKRQVSRDGQALALPKLSYRLFEVLADAAPNVVSTDELIEKVWSGRIVSPETITQRIKLLRQSLGDDAQHPQYIGLVRGEGYRLLPAVDVLADESDSVTTNLFNELGRRRVFQVALLYAAVAFSITEIVTFLIEALPVFPEWSKALVAIVFVVGFPVAMFLAWRFDYNKDGLQRTGGLVGTDKATIALAVALMVGATAGLFYLIYPSVVEDSKERFADGYRVREALPNAIVVLPFVNASGNTDDQYISEGMGDVLRDQLGNVPGLQVAARTSSIAFRDGVTSIEEISARLGVGVLIEGTLRREGETILISVRIIDAVTGFQTWQQTYTRPEGRLLSMQEQIGSSVVAQMREALQLETAVVQAATNVESAYELMLKARALEQQVSDAQIIDPEKMAQVIALYQQAIEADPESALAHSRLAGALIQIGQVDAAGAPVIKALTINPKLSRVQYTSGLFLFAQNQDGAGDAYLEALKLNPNNVDAYSTYAQWVWTQADATEPDAYFQQAIRLDPESLARYRDYGVFLAETGRKAQALELFREIEARFDYPLAWSHLARLYELIGELDLAIAWGLKAHNANRDNREIRWQLGELYARIGDIEGANYFEPDPSLGQYFFQRRYQEAIDHGEELMFDYPGELAIPYIVAFSYSALDRHDDAVNLLERLRVVERARSTSRFPADIEATMTLASAYTALGREAEAQRLATELLLPFFQRHIDTGNTASWWPSVYKACVMALLGDTDEALTSLQVAESSPGLVWYPFLRDAWCFAGLKEAPQYRATIDEVERRRRQLRDDLQSTIDVFGATQSGAR